MSKSPDPKKLAPARQVVEPTFSRNRNFDFYASPEGEALLPFRRAINGLVADLARVDADEPVRYIVNEATGQIWLELYIPRYRATRRCCLSVDEFEALKSHPLIGPRLRAGEGA